jgi:hypothetical protein
MASKGYGNLWIMAIGLIAVFVVATVIVPEFTGHGHTGSSDGWDSDMPSGEAIFLAPTTTLSASGLQVNQLVDFSVYASPVEDTTGQGGIFAWIFQLEGANGEGSIANLKYNDGASAVAWAPGSNGAIIGVGPRFVQGPGAVSMDASSSLSLALTESGKYTLKIWMASSSSTTDINPVNYTLVSPMVKISITVVEPVDASVSVEQAMSVPSNIAEDEWNSYSATTTAQGSKGWSEPIGIYVAIEKQGIKVSDVSVRINTGSGYSFPSFTDEGDRLVALITTRTPLTGGTDPESATWTTTFELSFATSGEYILTSWAEDRNSGEELTLVTYDTLEVGSTVVIPDPIPDPVDPNATNETDEPVVNDTQVAEPVADDEVEESAAANGTNRSSIPA